MDFNEHNHGHIVTGDLRIVKDVRLRKLLSKGPNFREHRSINFKKCKDEIIKALDNFILKYKLNSQAINDGKIILLKQLRREFITLNLLLNIM